MTAADLAKCRREWADMGKLQDDRRRSRWAMRWADRLLAAAGPVEPEDPPCRVSGENPGGDTPKGRTQQGAFYIVRLEP